MMRIERTSRSRLPGGAGTARRGFTLMEMVVVFFALGVGMFVGGALLLTASKVERSSEVASERMSRRLDLARQFRDDVARAQSAPQKFRNITAGPALLILQMPGQSTIVYQWENDELERFERKGEIETMRQSLPIASKGTTVEFIRPPNKEGIVSLRLTEPAGRGPARQTEFSAALGGNTR